MHCFLVDTEINRDPKHSPEQLRKFVEDEKGRYEGEVLFGKKHGKGVMIFISGQKYEGDWVNNNIEGQGSLYYANGQIAYEGGWKNGEFHGYGSTYNINPKKLDSQFNFRDFNKLDEEWVIYEGNFKEDVMYGTGKWLLSNGQSYEGEFKDGAVHGKGKYIKKNGKMMEGEWNDNVLIKIVRSDDPADRLSLTSFTEIDAQSQIIENGSEHEDQE